MSAATRIIASRLRSTSSSVVAHDETRIRMVEIACPTLGRGFEQALHE